MSRRSLEAGILVLLLLLGFFLGRVSGNRSSPKLGNFGEIADVTAINETLVRGLALSADEAALSSRPDRSRGPSPETLGFVRRLYRTIGDDGRLTWGIREIAGIDDATAATIQNSIDNAFLRLSDAARANLTYSSADSSPEQGRYVYRLDPFPDAGQEIWQDLQRDLVDIAGEHAAKLLTAALDPGQDFCFFGRYRYEFTYDPAGGRSGTLGPVITVKGFDPSTGEQVDSGAVRVASKPYWMWGLFESVKR